MISWPKLAVAVSVGLLAALGTLFLLSGGLPAEPTRVGAEQFQLGSGTGGPSATGFVVTGVGSNEQAMVFVSLQPSIEAEEYPIVRLNATGLDKAQGAGVFWVNSDEPTRGHPRPLTLAEVRGGQIDLAGSPAWRSQIIRVGFIVQGPLSAPVMFDSVTIEGRPVSLANFVSRVGRNWVSLSDWDGGSINFYVGAEKTERVLTPTLMIGLFALFAGVIYLLLRGPSPLVVVASLVVLGWGLLDLRWQADLWHRHATSMTDPSLEKDRLRAGQLEQLRVQLPEVPEGRRIFIVTSEPSGFDAYRTRYHLGALPTSFGLARLPTAAERRAGDVLIVLGLKERLEYSVPRQRLETDQESISATLIGNSPQTGGIFQIQPEAP